MINEAITFAVKAHEKQKRKGTKLPYIVHPMEVCTIVSHMTDDPELIAAAILHDTVEDCKEITRDMIEAKFGPRVAKIVHAESADKSKSWMERKGATLEFLHNTDDMDILMIALADKLANALSMKRDYDRIGDELWQRFNMKTKAMHAWYYQGLCGALSKTSQFPEYQELCDTVEYIFQNVIS